MKRCLVIGTINRYPAPEGWEYIHVDVQDRQIYDQATKTMTWPDALADVRDLRRVAADASIDRVQLWDVLEHLSKEGARSALNELRRVLRLGGELDVQVPDLAAAVLAYANAQLYEPEDRLDWDGLLQLVYGQHLGAGHGEPDYHRWGWSATTLRHALVWIGFEPGENLGEGSVVARYKATRRR